MSHHLQDFIYESVAKEAALRVHAVVVADIHTGEILYTSDLTEAMFGYEDGELRGVVVDILLPEGARERHAAYRVGFATSPRSRPMGHGMVLFGRKKNGNSFPVQVSLSSVDVLGRGVVVAYVTDLSEPVKTAVRIQEIVEKGTDPGESGARRFDLSGEGPSPSATDPESETGQ